MKNFFFLAAILFAVQSSQAQWEQELRLTWDPSSSQTTICSSVHAIASSGDSIHMVWYDSRDGNYEIYYIRSFDGGMTWGEEIRLTNGNIYSRYPTVAVSGTVVHVAWVEGYNTESEVYYKRSTDGGNTWGNDTRLTFTPSYTWHPCLAVSGTNVHMVYYDYCDGWWEAYYKHSADGGLNWEPDIRLTNDSAGSFWPAISASGPVLHVTWYDSRDGNSEIYYKQSSDNGMNWGADTRLTNNDSTSSYASLGVSGSDVYVVWRDKRDGNSELYFKRSTDGGLNWDPDYRLTSNVGESTSPNLVVSGVGLFVVWVDNSDGNKEIYFKRSADGGLNWSPDVRLTDDPSESNNAFISASNSKLHVVWYDSRDGNYEIYYKRDPTGGSIVAGFMADPTIVCPGEFTQFTDESTLNPIQWQWTFPGGIPGTSTQQNPQVIYNTPGSYDVTLFVSNGISNNQITKTNFITVLPVITVPVPGSPTGPNEICMNALNTQYTTTGSAGAIGYAWQIIPNNAGVVVGSGTTIMVNWQDSFTGEAFISVNALSDCSESGFSAPLTVTILPLPTTYTVTGGGSLCEGGIGVEIGLDNSETGKHYQLFYNGTSVSALPGTGLALSFGLFTNSGSYFVIATDTTTSCQNQMNNTVQVYAIPDPIAYQVAGGGSYCSGNMGTAITLSDSQTGHTYELLLGNLPTGITLPGTGGKINFYNISDTGTYTIRGTENTLLCSKMMVDSVDVYIIFNVPATPATPEGPDYVDIFSTPETEYTIDGSADTESYEWRLEPSDAGTVAIIDSTSIVISWDYSYMGLAKLSARGVNDCGPSAWSDSLAITIINTTGLDDAGSKISATIFPNPNNGIFSLKLQGKGADNLTISLSNVLGQVMYKNHDLTCYKNQDALVEFNIVSEGVYFMKIENDSAVAVYKIIVQKD